MHSTLIALSDVTENWYLNVDGGLINAILFIDLKKALTTRSFCQSWSCMGLKVQVWVFSETTSLTDLSLQLLMMWSLKLVAYVEGCPKAQYSAPCYSYCKLTTFQTVTSWTSQCYKCLGVQVGETLSWETHISEVVSKVAKVLAALRTLRPICPQSTLVTIYKSLILPHLNYCSAVWGCIGNGLSQKLEKLQNRAARIITGSGWDVRSAQILPALKWWSLADVLNNWNL